MYELNNKIKNLEPYQPNSGDVSIRCDANEACFNFSREIKESIKEAIDKIDFNRYPDPMATELCKAFAGYYKIDANLVTAGNGSDELISILMGSFLKKGDTVITVSMDFSMYNFYSYLAELNCISAEKEEDLSINIDKLIARVNESGAKALVFSNPCNPTSLGVEVEDIVRLVQCVDALVILDEAYMDFWKASLLSCVEHFDNLIILRTASKAVGAAALRLGFAVANTTLTKALRAVKSPYNVNTLTQEIGTILYSNTKYLEKLKKRIVTLRENLYNNLVTLENQFGNRLTLIEGNANFVFIHTKEAEAIYNYFLDKGIFIRFMGDYLRITTGTEEENKQIIYTLEEYLKAEIK